MSSPTFTGDKLAYTQEILATCPPRYAELSDVEAIVAFDSTVFPEGNPLGYRYLTNEINRTPLGNEILVIDGEIAAHVHGVIHPSNVEPGRCYGDIVSLGVAEEYRGRGVGELMLNHMVAGIMGENPTGICLHTRVSNLPMQRLAAKFGFVVEETVPDYYIRTRVPEDAYFMVFRPNGDATPTAA